MYSHTGRTGAASRRGVLMAPPNVSAMAKAADEPRGPGDTALAPMVRFGTALFAVPKDELPERKQRVAHGTPAPDA